MNPSCVQTLLCAAFLVDVTGRQLQHMNDSPSTTLPALRHSTQPSLRSNVQAPGLGLVYLFVCHHQPTASPVSFSLCLVYQPKRSIVLNILFLFFFLASSFSSSLVLSRGQDLEAMRANTPVHPFPSIPVFTAEYGRCNATHLPYMALILDDRWDGTTGPFLHSSWPSPLPPAPSTPYFPLWTLSPCFFIHTLHLPLPPLLVWRIGRASLHLHPHYRPLAFLPFVVLFLLFPS